MKIPMFIRFTVTVMNLAFLSKRAGFTLGAITMIPVSTENTSGANLADSRKTTGRAVRQVPTSII